MTNNNTTPRSHDLQTEQTNTSGGPFPETAGEIPAAAIHTAQDCLDFGTVQWDCRLIDQGGKRHVVGECVVTERRFECIWLDYTGDQFSRRESWTPYTLDRVIQFAPEHLDDPGDGLHLVGPYSKLKATAYTIDDDPDWSLDTEHARTLGPFPPKDCPHPSDLLNRLQTTADSDASNETSEQSE